MVLLHGIHGMTESEIDWWEIALGLSHIILAGTVAVIAHRTSRKDKKIDSAQ